MTDGLQRGEDHFRRLIENVSDIIQVFDEEGRIRYTSPSVERVLGYEPDDLAGRAAPEFVHPDDRPAVAAELQEALSTPDYREQMTFRLRHRTDGWRTCEVIAQSATDERGRPILIVNSRDVTARKEAEHALEERDAHLRRLLAGVRAIVWECDALTWEFSYISRGVEEILGYPVEEWYEDADLWVETIHPEDRTRVVEACTAGIEARRDSTLEYRAIARDGSVVWLRDIIHVVTGEAGEAERLQGVMIDITEEKNLEDQLRQAQKMEAVGRLAGGIAHDFNNALTAIQGYAELLLEALDEDAELRGDAEEIRRSAQHAAALTRQLLTFSRQQLVRPETLDLNAQLGNLQAMLERLIGDDCRLETDLSPDLWPVQADPAQIEQVMVNLVVNARDAMPDGGPIRIATRNASMSEEDVSELPFAMETGLYVLLSVSDTGSGIAPEVRERIYEPFFTTKEIGEGTGLGLSTVYGIVKQAGGYVRADSEPGQGTTFEIYLPRVPAAAGG